MIDVLVFGKNRSKTKITTTRNIHILAEETGYTKVVYMHCRVSVYESNRNGQFGQFCFFQVTKYILSRRQRKFQFLLTMDT